MSPHTPPPLRRCVLAALPLLLLAAAIALAGCAASRPALNTDELRAVRERYLTAARADTVGANRKMLARMQQEYEKSQAPTDADGPAPEPTLDILVLSGGGDYGAFGAGFLKGWGTVKDPQFVRPHFDVVTGVSTGALIAPFAFIGDDPSYDRLVDLYSSPKPGWFRTRGLFFFLPGNESFMDDAGLRSDLEASIDAAMIGRIAAESRANRVLAVNATNLDVGAMRPFDLGREAEVADASGDNDRVISILMASAAIPAVLPPVVIDGSLYVDGGTTSNILYGANWLSPKAPPALWKAAHPDEPFPRLRFWVIINNQLHTGAQIVQPTWLSITKASLATAIRSSTAVELRHLYSQSQAMNEKGYDVEFRYVAIPPDWIAPNGNTFDERVMRSLADLGLKMGRDPGSWRRDFTE